MACCSFDETVDQQFSAKRATRELDRYRRRGAGATARMLRDGLSKAGLAQGTLLDVGGGVGALTFELLERGMQSAVIIEASTAFTGAASTEVTRRRLAATVQLKRGDFLDVADRVRSAAVVTMDRVICCYPLYAKLLAEALRHAERVFAYSYPRDLWYVRAVVRLDNLLRRRKNNFQTFVHPEAAMRRQIEHDGFQLVSHAHTLVWSAAVFARRPAPSGTADLGPPER